MAACQDDCRSQSVRGLCAGRCSCISVCSNPTPPCQDSDYIIFILKTFLQLSNQLLGVSLIIELFIKGLLTSLRSKKPKTMHFFLHTHSQHRRAQTHRLVQNQVNAVKCLLFLVKGRAGRRISNHTKTGLCLIKKSVSVTDRRTPPQ